MTIGLNIFYSINIQEMDMTEQKCYVSSLQKGGYCMQFRANLVTIKNASFVLRKDYLFLFIQ